MNSVARAARLTPGKRERGNEGSDVPCAMTDEEQKVCDVCHERTATHHTFYGDTGETRYLCMKCFEQSASPAELESYRRAEQVIRNSKCQYCGAPAGASSMSFGIRGVMEEQTDSWCEACRLDLVEFSSRPENAMPEDFDVADETKLDQVWQQLAERKRRQDEFMHERVRKRGHNDAR